MHKINCMQSIEHISTWELFSSIIIVMFYQYAVDTPDISTITKKEKNILMCLHRGVASLNFKVRIC